MMRARWRNLFCCSLIALIGTAWMLDFDLWQLAYWSNPPIAGLFCAMMISLVAVITDTRKRWPAGVALVCLAPVAQALYHLVRVLPSRLDWIEMSDLLIFGGAAGALITAIRIVLVPAQPAIDDPIPAARSR